ncbi:NAD(P)/FAD-dependent oxidoreductase [Burkholderia glumae]|uniref:NAD(P)/FAD-dependent oxidoreductase n=1 Tax=Burkholderia glumae TaxID=337 RepID=UPI0021518428|nr:NAD(P)/FAD-dependent oxidoreductase [Burkholderia glumae]
MSATFDYLIVGGGPAAAREALRLAGTDASVGLVSNGYGGCMKMMGDMALQSYPNELELQPSPLRLRAYIEGMRMSPSGREYATYITDLIHSTNVTRMLGKVDFIERHGELFVCHLSGGNGVAPITARRLILATGLRPRDIPGAFMEVDAINCFEAYTLLAAPQTAAALAGKNVVIVGSGNSAFQIAALASLVARSVCILSRGYLGLFPQETGDRFALRAPSQLTIELIGKSMAEGGHSHAITQDLITPVSFLVYRDLMRDASGCRAIFHEADNHCHIARLSWRYAVERRIVTRLAEPQLWHGVFPRDQTIFISAIGVTANLPDSQWRLLDDTTRFVSHDEGRTAIPNLFIAGTVGGCRSVNTMAYPPVGQREPFLN